MIPRGASHYAWKGDDAPDTTKRSRIQRRLSLDGVICAAGGCEAPATDRHHIDGDTGNNRLENIRCLCRRHHMEEDGRLERLIQLARENAQRQAAKPPTPCVTCESERGPKRRGRCPACSEYQRRTGRERPPRLWS